MREIQRATHICGTPGIEVTDAYRVHPGMTSHTTMANPKSATRVSALRIAHKRPVQHPTGDRNEHGQNYHYADFDVVGGHGRNPSTARNEVNKWSDS